MAYRDQRRVVCSDRHTGGRGVRALPLASLAFLLIAAVASAQGTAESRRDLAGSTLPDAPAWWSEYGRPGWIGDTWLAAAVPWMLAGHVRGGWELNDPHRAPHHLPYPGAGAAYPPLAWYDTLAVTTGEGGPWAGFQGSLATATVTGGQIHGTHSVIHLVGGAFAFDDDAILVNRRDSLSWLRAEASSSNHNVAGALDASGRHLWGVTTGASRGAHAVEFSFAQRGVGTRLVGSEEESNSAKSGSASYRLQRGTWRADAGFARGSSHAESFANFYDLSRRDADEISATAGVAHDSGVEGHLEYRRGHVVRSLAENTEWSSRSLWGAARWTHPGDYGLLMVEVGAGKHDSRKGLDWAPAVSFRTHAGGVATRVGFERVLHAVWSDLGGADPFLQNTWASVIEIGAGDPLLRGGRIQLLGGRTRSRAVMTRVPNTEFALRTGILPDPEQWSFGLLCADGRWPTRWALLGGEGFLLWSSEQVIQTRVDPGSGARVWAEASRPWFGGDLGSTIRFSMEAVGPREVEGDLGTVLPGYATGELMGRFTLADAWISLRVRNLENWVRRQPWIDSVTGEPALGTGREWRLAFTMVLRN